MPSAPPPPAFGMTQGFNQPPLQQVVMRWQERCCGGSRLPLTALLEDRAAGAAARATASRDIGERSRKRRSLWFSPPAYSYPWPGMTGASSLLQAGPKQ